MIHKDLISLTAAGNILTIYSQSYKILFIGVPYECPYLQNW
jgi:hypothetical protein